MSQLTCCLIVAGVALALAACRGSSETVRACPPSGCHPSVGRGSTAKGASPRAAHLLDQIASRLIGPPTKADTPITFRDRQYMLEITNAGSPTAYTLDRTVLFTVKVMPDSSAVEHAFVVKPLTFISRVSRRHWRAAGSPRLRVERRRSYSWTDPARDFSFIPHGVVLTYRQARELPAQPSAILQRFRKLTGVRVGDTDTAALLLQQYGFVLAVSPISPQIRRAILRAMARLSGIAVCGRAVLCVRGGVTRTEVALNPRNGVALIVRERLEEPAGVYPGVRIGDLVQSDRFSLVQRLPHSR